MMKILYWCAWGLGIVFLIWTIICFFWNTSHGDGYRPSIYPIKNSRDIKGKIINFFIGIAILIFLVLIAIYIDSIVPDYASGPGISFKDYP